MEWILQAYPKPKMATAVVVRKCMSVDSVSSFLLLDNHESMLD